MSKTNEGDGRSSPEIDQLLAELLAKMKGGNAKAQKKTMTKALDLFAGLDRDAAQMAVLAKLVAPEDQRTVIAYLASKRSVDSLKQLASFDEDPESAIAEIDRVDHAFRLVEQLDAASRKIGYIEKQTAVSAERLKGANVRHRLNHANKAATFLWLKAHRARFQSQDECAEHLIKEVAIEHSTARTYVIEFDREHGRPPRRTPVSRKQKTRR